MTTVTTHEHTQAQLSWATLAPLLAGTPTMRVSRDGGRNFTRRDSRRLTGKLPSQPAAVMIYDKQGCAPVVILDLDTSRGDVEADLLAAATLLAEAGVRWFSDHSPNGGRHLYVPFTEPVPFPEARAVVKALATTLPTLDPLPMLNATEGCIRPPGARHSSGGHQQLDGTLEAAQALLQEPNHPAAWRRLQDHLGVGHTASHRPLREASAQLGQQGNLPALPGFTHPDATYAAIARTGDYDHTRYATPSEARQAVIWSCVASGWTFGEVVRRIEDGTWRGLASFYRRYRQGHRRTALVNDWRAACAFEKRRRETGQHSHVRRCTTSPTKTQGGAHRPHLRTWLAAVDHVTAGAGDLSVRAVLYALGEAAAVSGSLTVEFGNRHLAVATGLHHTTVGRVLKALVTAPPDKTLLDLVSPARATRANVYQLVVPALLRPACERAAHRRGKIHAIRPAFRDLGLTSAFVYAALEHHDHPTDGRSIAASARLSVDATYDALATLHAWGLADRVAGGWVLGHGSLQQLAEAWGITDRISDQLADYRSERAAWHAWLIARGILRAPIEPAPEPPVLDSLPPPDLYEAKSPLELVQQILGGQIVA